MVELEDKVSWPERWQCLQGTMKKRSSSESPEVKTGELQGQVRLQAAKGQQLPVLDLQAFSRRMKAELEATVIIPTRTQVSVTPLGKEDGEKWSLGPTIDQVPADASTSFLLMSDFPGSRKC